ncbi:MAG: efflux RND transporter periplasmic adaptor subunit [Pseudomonadota bacterium]
MIISRMTRTALTIASVALLVACNTGGSRPESPEPARAATAVTVAPVIQQSINEWDVFTGTLVAPEQVQLRARVSGYLAEVTFTEGQRVAKGDMLFQIDDRPFRAEVERLQAELASAESQLSLSHSQLRRAKELAEKQAISREMLEQRDAANQQAAARVESITASLEHALLQLEFTQVRAPIDGRVSNARITAGNFINAGDSILTTIVSTEEIYAYFDADEQSYLKYARMAREGARPSSREEKNPVLLGLAGDTEFGYPGHMDFVDNKVDPTTGTIRGRAVFDNSDGFLIPGMFARIQLVGSGTYEGILVDDRAIGTDLDRRYVLVVDASNTVHYREVELGEKVSGLRLITEGLNGDEVIVVRGLQSVRAGDSVNPNQVSMAKPGTLDALAALQQQVVAKG